MQNYELMVIFTPVLSEEELQTRSEKVRRFHRCKRWFDRAPESLGAKITGVSRPEKDHWSLLGHGIQCAIRH